MKEIVEKFLYYLELEKGYSPHTLRNYRLDLEEFSKYFFGKKYLSDLQSLELRAFIAHLYEKNSKRSIARKLSSLRSMVRWMVKKNLLQKDFSLEIPMPKVEQKLPHFLSQEQVLELLEQPNKAEWQGARDLAMMELLYSSGIRVSELVALNYGDLNFSTAVGEGGTAIVKGKGNKERMIVFGSLSRAALEKYLAFALPRQENNEALFVNYQGGRLSARSVERTFASYVVKAGLPAHTSPHTLRHSFATHMMAQGADLRLIQDLLGHASLSTTQKYTHINVAELMDAYRKTEFKKEK